jgi:hypothetical protein
MSELPTFSAADVAAHSTKSDLWLTIQGKGMFAPLFYLDCFAKTHLLT